MTIKGGLRRISEGSSALLHVVEICVCRGGVKSLVIVPQALQVPVAKTIMYRKRFLS